MELNGARGRIRNQHSMLSIHHKENLSCHIAAGANARASLISVGGAVSNMRKTRALAQRMAYTSFFSTTRRRTLRREAHRREGGRRGREEGGGRQRHLATQCFWRGMYGDCMTWYLAHMAPAIYYRRIPRHSSTINSARDAATPLTL